MTTTATAAMNGNVFEADNKMACTNCHRLYLDSKTADVKFVFADSGESVPALKAILSVTSPVFDAMFYGSLPETGDISIVDATPEAFRQFLQFFYLSKVQLDTDHVFQVANLCKKYEVNDGLTLCETPMRHSLTINNMCTGYATAKLLEMESVIELCEQNIQQNAAEILNSTDWLECNHETMDNILQLVSSKCSASEIVDACMNWAKAKCERENVEQTSVNLKAQLKGIVERMPFVELNWEQFSEHITKYKRFLAEDELEAIILKRAQKSHAFEMAVSTDLFCCRRGKCTNGYVSHSAATPNEETFISNTKLLLKELYVATSVQTYYGVTMTLHLHNYQNGKELILGEIDLNRGRSGDARFVFPFPVAIEPNTKYGIIFVSSFGNRFYWLKGLKNCVKLDGGIEIRFDAASSVITAMVFQKLAA